MISVVEALAHIQAHTRDFGIEMVGLLQAPGRILATDIVADRDFPPYDRVMMDGIALSSQAFEAGRRAFRIEQLQPAGDPQLQLQSDSACIEIMTGAVLPLGTDLVIPYEDCSIADGIATIQLDSIRIKQYVHLQGADCLSGDLLIGEGKRITPGMVGTMATVGMDKVAVRRLPRVAVCASGDELVDITDIPQAHQIRRSNSYMLAAALREEGIVADTYHLPDDGEVMKATLSGLLPQYEVLLFSGAVSKGRFDFLPVVLGELGMQTVFHRVAQKPGKPFLFGTFEQGPVVFGLPGNPASTMVCYRIFFQTWLHASLNYRGAGHTARLRQDIEFSPPLSYHLLVSLETVDGVLMATPGKGGNSGDMVGLQQADAILSLPPDKSIFRQGEAYPLTFLSPMR